MHYKIFVKGEFYSDLSNEILIEHYIYDLIINRGYKEEDIQVVECGGALIGKET